MQYVRKYIKEKGGVLFITWLWGGSLGAESRPKGLKDSRKRTDRRVDLK